MSEGQPWLCRQYRGKSRGGVDGAASFSQEAAHDGLRFRPSSTQSKDWERLHRVLNGWTCLRTQRAYSLNGNTIVATHFLTSLTYSEKGKTEGLALFRAVTTSWKQAHPAEFEHISGPTWRICTSTERPSAGHQTQPNFDGVRQLSSTRRFRYNVTLSLEHADPHTRELFLAACCAV